MGFATIEDVIALWKPLSEAETAKATALIPLISDALRYEAQKVGRNLDTMIADNATLASVAKVVVVDIISRAMRQNPDAEPVKQETQSALGYSFTATYAIEGGGIANAIMKNDLKRLGIYRQRIGTSNPFGGSRA